MYKMNNLIRQPSSYSSRLFLRNPHPINYVNFWLLLSFVLL